MQHVISGLETVQRTKVIGCDDALAQLLEIRIGYDPAKLGLPDKEALKRGGILDLEIRKHSQFFEGAFRQVLRLVHDQERAAPLSVGRIKEFLQPEQKTAFVKWQVAQPERRGDHSQKIVAR